MHKLLPGLLVAMLCCVRGIAQTPETSSLYRFDPAFDSIVAPGSRIEKLADSAPTAREPDTRDGPVWMRDGGYLLYTSLGAQQIEKWDPRSGLVTTYLAGTAAVGMTLDGQGRIVWASDAELSGGGIVRLEKDGKRTTLATRYEGKPLNNPKELVYARDGTLYFTDPGHYPARETETPSIYSLKSGTVRLLVTDERIVSGLAFSPDGKYLYYAGLHALVLRSEVLPEGALSAPQIFFDMEAFKHAHPAWPDAHAIGITVDAKGDVYAIGPGGVWILSPRGKPLGAILGMNRPANLAFGGSDGKTLYVTSRPGLYRVNVLIAGDRH
jgi:gluconolactonase